MKKMNLVAVSVMMALSASGAFAEGKGNHPCKKIKEACEAAGYTKGDHKNKKGLFKDCMQPIMAGQAVAGVTADPADVSACQAKKAARKEK